MEITEEQDSLEYHSAEETQQAETSRDSIVEETTNKASTDVFPAERHELITFDSILSSSRVDEDEEGDEEDLRSRSSEDSATHAAPIVLTSAEVEHLQNTNNIIAEDFYVDNEQNSSNNDLQQRLEMLERENYMLKQLVSTVAQRLQVDVDDLFDTTPEERNFDQVTTNMIAVIDHLQHSLETENTTMEEGNDEEEASDLPHLYHHAGMQHHKDRGFSISSQRTNVSKADLMSLDWLECVDVHPPPPFDFESPVVDHVFQTWTEDVNKIQYLKSWVHSLKTSATDAYPIGIQITSVSNILRDAFVVLIIPLMRVKSIDPLVVYIREYKTEQEQPQSSSRQLSTTSDHQSHITEDARSSQPEVVNSDPFVKSHDIVYDIRIKRIAEQRHHSSSSLSQHVQFRDINKHGSLLSQAAFRVDSKDYSSLSEINMIFKEIEKGPNSTRSLSMASDSPKTDIPTVFIAPSPHSGDVTKEANISPTSSPAADSNVGKVPAAAAAAAAEGVAGTSSDVGVVATSPPAFFPASISSWFYGTSIHDTTKINNAPNRHAKSTTSDLLESGSISSEPSTFSESKLSTSANKRAPDKIAARLEALRKKA